MTDPSPSSLPPLRVGLIGALGWIGSALGRALLDTGTVAPERLTVLTRGAARAPYLGFDRVVWAGSVAELVGRSDVVIVSVRPQDWPALDLYAPETLVISLMAQVPIAALAGCGGRVVRAMPNALAEVRRSYSPWVAGPDLTQADRAAVTRILTAIGPTEPLPREADLDVISILSGAGPAYPALMAAALLAFARAQGLEETAARHAVEAVICDGGGGLRGQIETAETTVQSFRDYRGITAAGLEAAEAAGFSRALHAGLAAALDAARRR